MTNPCAARGHYFVPSISPAYVRCAMCMLTAGRVELGTGIVVHEGLKGFERHYSPYKAARGAIHWEAGMERAEDTIRRGRE